VIADHIAGDPMDEKIKWVKLTRKKISQELNKKGLKVSKNIVKKLLKRHGFVKRKMQRKTSTGEYKDRDEQFNHIDKIKSEYMNTNNPILSIDTKKNCLFSKICGSFLALVNHPSYEIKRFLALQNS